MKTVYKERIHKLARDMLAEGADKDDVMLALTETSIEFMQEVRQMLKEQD